MNKKSKQNVNIGRFLRDNTAVLILLVFLIIGFAVINPISGNARFTKNFYQVFMYAAQYGAVCLGLGLIMIVGNIDLSVGFQAGLCGVTTVIVFNECSAAGGSVALSLILGVLAALVCGLLCGLINGVVITKFGVSPLIATIATNYIFKGLVRQFANTSFPLSHPDALQAVARTRIFGWRWLTPMVIIFFVLVALIFLWMYFTRFGSRLHYIGDNPEAAAFAGISVPGTVFVTYLLCGFLCAISGIMMVGWDGYAIYTQGNALSTLPISCCVIGGIKMMGGKGTAIHILLGVLIMLVIQTIMSCLYLSQDMMNLISGLLLIGVLIMDRFTSVKKTDDF